MRDKTQAAVGSQDGRLCGLVIANIQNDGACGERPSRTQTAATSLVLLHKIQSRAAARVAQVGRRLVFPYTRELQGGYIFTATARAWAVEGGSGWGELAPTLLYLMDSCSDHG